MVSETPARSRVAPEEALRIGTERFSVSVTLAESLTSPQGQDFLLSDEASGRGHVLKLSHDGEDPQVPDLQNRMLEHLVRAGFPLSNFLSTNGPEENVLKIKPPLVFTTYDADRLISTLDRVLEEDGVRAWGGELPDKPPRYYPGRHTIRAMTPFGNAGLPGRHGQGGSGWLTTPP